MIIYKPKATLYTHFQVGLKHKKKCIKISPIHNEDEFMAMQNSIVNEN